MIWTTMFGNMERLSFLLPVLLCTVAVSCQKDPGEPEKGNDRFIAESVMLSRTYLDDTSILWSDDDAIKIFNATASSEYILIGGQGTTRGTFEGKRISGGPYYAVYPSSAEATCNAGAGTITAAVPALQYGVIDSFSDNINLAVAKSESKNLQFKNVCGYIRLQIIEEDITEIVIRANSGAAMAGTVTLSFDAGGLPQVSSVSDASSSITLRPSSGTAFTPGVYIAAVLPGTYTGGITVSMTRQHAQEDALRVYPMRTAKTGTNALTIERSVVKTIGIVDEGMAWECLGYNDQGVPMGTHNSYSSYGQFVDFQSARTFSAIGAYVYADALDACSAYSSGFGLFSTAASQASSLYNATNLGYIDSHYTEDDVISNWAAKGYTKNITYFEKLTSAEIASDAAYANLTTYALLKKAYDDAFTRSGHTLANRPIGIWSPRGNGSTVSFTTDNKIVQETIGTYFAFKMEVGGILHHGVFKVVHVEGGEHPMLKFIYKIGSERTGDAITP